VCEGLHAPGLRAFGVQHHPEAGPGPHDSRYLFETFRRLIDEQDATR
jgi:carbamoyl-phosphate synthase small subunit